MFLNLLKFLPLPKFLTAAYMVWNAYNQHLEAVRNKILKCMSFLLLFEDVMMSVFLFIFYSNCFLYILSQ